MKQIVSRKSNQTLGPHMRQMKRSARLQKKYCYLRMGQEGEQNSDLVATCHQRCDCSWREEWSN